MPGRVIILSGTSSAGKSTLAKALREDMPEPLYYLSIDQLIDGDFNPLNHTTAVDRLQENRSIFEGFNRTIRAFAEAGCNLVVELVIQSQEWADDLVAVLAELDVLWVWVWAPTVDLTAREMGRGNRRVGTSALYAQTRSFCHYDLEIDTSQPMAESVFTLAEAWRALRPPTS